MLNTKIAFIGAGNMAGSLLGGLIQKGHTADHLWASCPDAQRLAQLQQQYPKLQTTTSNQTACAAASVIVLAVKPQILKSVCQEIAATIQQTTPLIISVAAGIQTTQIQQWLNYSGEIIRAMPNTPALVGAGATGLFATPQCSTHSKTLAEALLQACGITVWITEETHMDLVTALSGSGPAYFFLMVESLIKAATHLGLPTDTATILANQTALGSARLLLETQTDAQTLRKQVTSPNGTTEKGIQALEQNGFPHAIEAAITAAFARGQQLSKTFD